MWSIISVVWLCPLLCTPWAHSHLVMSCNFYLGFILMRFRHIEFTLFSPSCLPSAELKSDHYSDWYSVLSAPRSCQNSMFVCYFFSHFLKLMENIILGRECTAVYDDVHKNTAKISGSRRCSALWMRWTRSVMLECVLLRFPLFSVLGTQDLNGVEQSLPFKSTYRLEASRSSLRWEV